MSGSAFRSAISDATFKNTPAELVVTAPGDKELQEQMLVTLKVIKNILNEGYNLDFQENDVIAE